MVEDGRPSDGPAADGHGRASPLLSGTPPTGTLEELNRKLDLLIGKVDALEALLGTGDNPLLSSLLRGVRLQAALAEDALRGADYLSRLGVRDRIAQDVLEALLERDGQNVSQLTERIRTRRGSASRRVVTAKLAALEHQGLVKERPGSGRAKRFYLKGEKHIEDKHQF